MMVTCAAQLSRSIGSRMEKEKEAAGKSPMPLKVGSVCSTPDGGLCVIGRKCRQWGN